MGALFQGERNSASRDSFLTDVYHHHHHHHDDNDRNGTTTTNRPVTTTVSNNGQLNTPPDDYPFPDADRFGLAAAAASAATSCSSASSSSNTITAWLEVWDYVGGLGFRGFVSEDADTAERSAFVFFDAQGVLGRDLKQALVAIVELADGALGCSNLVVAVDRAIPERDARALLKGLQWAGFELAPLDRWAGGALDVTSGRWLFMAYEV